MNLRGKGELSRRFTMPDVARPEVVLDPGVFRQQPSNALAS